LFKLFKFKESAEKISVVGGVFKPQFHKLESTEKTHFFVIARVVPQSAGSTRGNLFLLRDCFVVPQTAGVTISFISHCGPASCGTSRPAKSGKILTV